MNNENNSKSILKKITLLCSAIAASTTGMFALSTAGAFGVAGAAIAGTALITHEVRKHRNNKAERINAENEYRSKKVKAKNEYRAKNEKIKTKETKQSVKAKISDVKSDIRAHKRAINKLDPNNPAVAQHQTAISELKNELALLKDKLKSL